MPNWILYWTLAGAIAALQTLSLFVVAGMACVLQLLDINWSHCRKFCSKPSWDFQIESIVRPTAVNAHTHSHHAVTEATTILCWPDAINKKKTRNLTFKKQLRENERVLYAGLLFPVYNFCIYLVCRTGFFFCILSAISVRYSDMLFAVVPFWLLFFRSSAAGMPGPS